MMISNFNSNILYSYEITSFSNYFKIWDHFLSPAYEGMNGMIQQHRLRKYTFLWLGTFTLEQGTEGKSQQQKG